MFDGLGQVFNRYGFYAAAWVFVVVLDPQSAKRGDGGFRFLPIEVPRLAHDPNAVVLSNCLLCDIIATILTALNSSPK